MQNLLAGDIIDLLLHVQENNKMYHNVKKWTCHLKVLMGSELCALLTDFQVWVCISVFSPSCRPGLLLFVTIMPEQLDPQNIPEKHGPHYNNEKSISQLESIKISTNSGVSFLQPVLMGMGAHIELQRSIRRPSWINGQTMQLIWYFYFQFFEKNQA